MNIVIPGWLAVLITLICATKVLEFQTGWTAEQPITYPVTQASTAPR